MLEEDIQKKDPIQAQADITRISSAAEMMELFITTLLNLSRSGKSVKAPVRIPFTDLAREAAGLLATPLNEHRVSLVIPDNLPEVSGDRERLLQVMINLLDNAVKFMGDQKEPPVEVGVRADAETPVFFVKDNGRGSKKKISQRSSHSSNVSSRSSRYRHRAYHREADYRSPRWQDLGGVGRRGEGDNGLLHAAGSRITPHR
jgi:K+-sensing histidine kinase KdpD